jgi:SAM-dependent methyltransferase
LKVCLNCSHRFEGEEWRCSKCRFIPARDGGHLVFAPDLARGSAGFREEYFDELSVLETKNFWFRSRNKLILWALGKYFPATASLMEIGCGTGFVLAGIEKAFPRASLTGSEVSSAALTFASKRLERAQLIQMDARNIPFEDEFDVVGAFDVIEHIEDDELVLRQMYKALRAGGGVILTVPQHRFLWSRQDEQACHVRRYTRRELEGKLKAANFEIAHMTSFVSFLMPLMMLSRLKKNIDSRSDALDELRLHPAPSFLFEQVLTLERALVKIGIDFPFGGSLLAVARKSRFPARRIEMIPSRRS